MNESRKLTFEIVVPPLVGRLNGRGHRGGRYCVTRWRDGASRTAEIALQFGCGWDGLVLAIKLVIIVKLIRIHVPVQLHLIGLILLGSRVVHILQYLSGHWRGRSCIIIYECCSDACSHVSQTSYLRCTQRVLLINDQRLSCVGVNRYARHQLRRLFARTLQVAY